MLQLKVLCLLVNPLPVPTSNRWSCYLCWLALFWLRCSSHQVWPLKIAPCQETTCTRQTLLKLQQYFLFWVWRSRFPSGLAHKTILQTPKCRTCNRNKVLEYSVAGVLRDLECYRGGCGAGEEACSDDTYPRLAISCPLFQHFSLSFNILAFNWARK